MAAVMESVKPMLDDLRFPSIVIDGLLAGALQDLGNQRISERLQREQDLQALATRMAQDLLIAVTLAQTLSPGAPFGSMIPHAPFSAHDKDLQELGHVLFRKMIALDRLPDDAVSDSLLKERFDKVQMSI